MEKTLVASGKSIDLAIESALAQLGLDRDSVSVQVLQQAKPGFLGFGAAPAKVQVTYEAPDEVVVPAAPKSALGAASRSKPVAAAPVKKPEAPKPVQEVKPVQEKPAAPKQQPKAEKPRQERKSEPAKAPKPPKVYAPAPEGSVEEKIEKFIKGLLENMDSAAVPHCVKGEENTYFVVRRRAFSTCWAFLRAYLRRLSSRLAR